MSITLAAFSPEEKCRAHLLLASRVATMLGRKFEEADWSDVYCMTKGIPHSGWSNLNIDVMHEGLGVEHKMLCYRSNLSIGEACGTTLMHPAATRSIRIPIGEKNATKAAREVLEQYAEVIESRRKVVLDSSGGKRADLRTGWLLWQESLREFLYFEEEMLPPKPNDFFAEWKVNKGGGNRKETKNLWVYEESTGKKRFSITTMAGAKIQPYFDVPPPTDSNLYKFIVQGENVTSDNTRIWLTPSTALILSKLIGSLGQQELELAIKHAKTSSSSKEKIEEAVPVIISNQSYLLLQEKFKGVSDEHLFQQLVQQMMKK